MSISFPNGNVPLLSILTLEHPEISQGWHLQKHDHSETVLVRKCCSKSCRYGPPPVVLFPGMQCLNAGVVEEFLDPNFGWALQLNQAVMWSSLSLRPSQLQFASIRILVQWGLVGVSCAQNLCSQVSFSTGLGAVAPAALGRLAVGRSGE